MYLLAVKATADEYPIVKGSASSARALIDHARCEHGPRTRVEVIALDRVEKVVAVVAADAVEVVAKRDEAGALARHAHRLDDRPLVARRVEDLH